MNADFSFIFIQESLHLPSSKDIFDSSNRYLTFHASAIDETVHVTCRRGGLITYVNTKITSSTSVHSSSKSYLATITGSLVCINVYLPQRNLFKNGDYDNAVGDLIAIVEELGSSYAYLFLGDFNTSGPNKVLFRKLIDRLDLEDWSKEIRVTFSAGVKNNKLCATKLDHVLAKNIDLGTCISCITDSSLVTKGGHSAIVTTAYFPHLHSVGPDSNTDENQERPIYLDYSNVSPEQIRSLRREMAEIIEPYMNRQIHSSDNPISIINRVFTSIGSRATFILNQKRYSQRHKKVPGWTKYNMSDIQRRIRFVENEWREEGYIPDSGVADELKFLKNLRQNTLSEIRQDENRLVAEAMADDLSGPSTQDRSRCWKPVRQCIKGSTESISPIIENRRNQKDIVNFWLDFYKGKLDGLESPDLIDSEIFQSICDHNSIIIK